jgi:glyoxylase-like metal-dependent hydrolase (beta-lactamase superfamily II)
MEYRRLILGPLETNCYILFNGKCGDCIIVDPAYEFEKIVEVITELKKNPMLAVLTHTHFDHIGALKDLKDNYRDMKILLHPLEKDMLKSQSGFARFFGIKIKEPPPPDGLIDEGDVLQLGGERLEVLYTPGHSSGSISLLNRNDRFVIVGDLLFQGSIGRTDFPGGSFEEIKRSIQKKIYSLSDDFLVLSGHGESTRVGIEKKENPFVRGES